MTTRSATIVVLLTAMLAALLTTASAQARPSDACAGKGLVVVVNGTNDDPPPDTTPAVARYQRMGYRAHTLVYPATIWPLGASSYDDNVRLAVPRLARLLDWWVRACPSKPLALVAFSQGSRIVGDVVSAAGTARPIQTPKGPVTLRLPADKLRVELYADPRRDPVPGVKGAGVETLFPNTTVYNGLTMTGSRPGGFGRLTSRVVEVCIVGDPICDSVRPPDNALIPTLVLSVFRFSLRHTRYGPDADQPMASDPWRHATNGTWMAPPPRIG
uniref:hypothetical protein n=1 Tax=Gordonia sp. B7-2 TaxID=3420932 RepID=UPI003D9213F1